MQQEEYLNQFELNLTRTLIKVLTQQNRLSGTLLPSPDLDDKWEAIAEPYIADAVKEIATYPTVALGWMMYVGMAVAHLWDIDWSVYGNIDHLYEYLRDKRGFDRLDEYIRETTLGIRPTEPEYTRLEGARTHVRHYMPDPDQTRRHRAPVPHGIPRVRTRHPRPLPRRSKHRALQARLQDEYQLDKCL